MGRSGTLWIAVAGVLAVTAYAVLSAVQILVLNPLAAVPGMSLAEIQAGMSEAGEEVNGVAVMVFLGTGPVLALGAAVLIVRGRMRPAAAAMMFLLIILFGAAAHFVASFGPGMAIADAFGVGGGDHTGIRVILYGVSAACGVVALALGIGLSRSPKPAATTA